MTDEILPFYEKELAYIKRLAGDFAEQHPKIAGRLRITQDVVEDPHVSRLIEGFAYLTARTRKKIEDDFPELSESILNVLYPHYLAPFPSCAISRFQLGEAQAELTAGYEIPAGSELETEPIDGEPCRFRTCYPVKLWPFSLARAEFRGPPFSAPKIRLEQEAQAVVHFQLTSFNPEIPFSSFSIDSLRLFLNGDSQSIYDLYEFVLNETLAIAVADSPQDKEPIVLPASAIRPVGFDENQGLIDYPSRSFVGYRLLSEYFAFPEKFLFFDIDGLTEELLDRKGTGPDLHLYLYLKNHSGDVENNTRESSFQLGCTPIVNLFQQRAEPIQMTAAKSEYRIVPDARRPLASEVFSIDEVVATTQDSEEIVYQPFFSVNHQHRNEDCYWYPSRRVLDHPTDRGTEVFLNLVNLDFAESRFDERCLDVKTTSLNRDLPSRLPINAHFLLVGHSELVDTKILVSPTRTLRPELGSGATWRLISHLNLNHLSLADSADGVVALKEILKLYDRNDSKVTKTMIEGILSVESSRVVGRVGGHVASGFARGTEVTLNLDEEKFIGAGVYLFATVLDRFLGLYTTINSFTRTRAITSQRGLLFESPPRNGYKPIF